MTGFISSSLATSSNFNSVLFQPNLSLAELMKTDKYLWLRDQIKRIPKVELHVHLGGAVPLEFLRKHSPPAIYVELIDIIDKIRAGVDYSDAFKAFELIGKVLNTDELAEEAAYSFCKAQFEDRVTYTEVRTGLKNLGTGFEGYLQAVLRGLKRGKNEFNIEVNLILSLRRNTPAKEAMETVQMALKYRKEGVTGIDISGESTKGDCSTIFDAINLAKINRLPITLHIGEQASENPEQQMKELNHIVPQRIGHAVHLCPEAKAWVDRFKPVIEICLNSAVCVGMIKHPKDHPGLKMMREGHKVVFCTDDPTLFGSHSSELAVAACVLDLSVSQIRAMQDEAEDHNFAASCERGLIYPMMSVSELMTTERYAVTRTCIRSLPKVDLHADLSGSLSIEFLRKHCSPALLEELLEKIYRIQKRSEYSEVTNVLSQFKALLNTESRVEEAAYTFCSSQAADNVRFTELRTELKDLELGFESYLKAILRGLDSGQREFKVTVGLVLTLHRNTPLNEAMIIVELAINYRDLGVWGIALSGEGDSSAIIEAVNLAIAAEVPITLSIGEKANEDTLQQFKELTRIRPKRIGHAVHLGPQARAWVDKYKPVIEVSLKSALYDQAIDLPREHPAFELIHKRHKVVFCAVNSTLNGDLSSELAVAACVTGGSLMTIKNQQAGYIDELLVTPEYVIYPNVLETEDINLLMQCEDLGRSEEQWYGRTTLWKESYKAVLRSAFFHSVDYRNYHKCTSVIDKLTKCFLRSIQKLNPRVTDQKVDLEIYIDRNRVTKENASKSGMFWHRDRVTTDGGQGFADYSFVYLMSSELNWKGGEMSLQKGGKPISREEWQNSSNPIFNYQPLFNQAIIFKNSDSAHSVEPIEPVLDWNWTNRDVVVITAVLEKTAPREAK